MPYSPQPSKVPSRVLYAPAIMPLAPSTPNESIYNRHLHRIPAKSLKNVTATKRVPGNRLPAASRYMCARNQRRATLPRIMRRETAQAPAPIMRDQTRARRKGHV